jgi:Septum formation
MAMRTRTVALLTSLLLGLACAACTDGSRSPVAAPPTSSHTRSADVPPPPEVGQCRNTPANDSWVDDTPVIDCSKPHTLEMVSVIKPVEKLTLATVKELGNSCEAPFVAYLGIGSREVRTLVSAVFWPSGAQRAAGQNWVRCDAGVSPTTACCRHLAPQSGSLHNAVDSDPVRFHVCISQLPDPPAPQPLTSCKKSHRAEALPSPLELSVTTYPSEAVLTRQGRAGCARLLAGRHDLASLVVTPDWYSKANWGGGTLFGRCWIHRKSGLLAPLKR